MWVLNKSSKILLGSGAFLLFLWVGFLAFSTSSVTETILSAVSSKQPQFVKKEYPEPNSPWRKVSLESLEIPGEAKEKSKLFVPKSTIIPPVDPLDAQSHFLDVAPMKLSSDSTLVFLHGAAFTSSDWEDLGTPSLFGALGYQSKSIDLPGFGKTPKKLSEMKKFVSNVQFMSTVLNVIKANKTILIAPSMSGAFALPYALTYPDKLAGLVLIAPTASDLVPQSKLRAFQVPTLLIYGSNDKKLGPKSQKYLKSIPNFQTIIFEGAGHAAYLDQPDRFHKVLYNFIKKIETGV